MGKKFIGIDLGTSTSAVAVMENGKPIAVTNNEGSRITPSMVCLKDGERKVGESAKRQRVVNPKETINLIKRFMGVDYKDTEDIRKHVQYDVVNVNGKPRAKVEGREYSPEEISSMILAKMKKTAEDYVGEEIKDAVITVPAWFDNAAREATKIAGEMAGLTVHRIIAEPTAGILASNIDTKSTKDSTVTVMVADIGGGTSDFSVCEISDGLVEVKASHGDVFLGGSDFDNALTAFLIDTFKKEHNVDLSEDSQAYARILEAAEKAKVELSTVSSTEINLPYITVIDNKPQHLIQTVTRAKFEQLTSHLVDRIIDCAKEAVKKAKINYSDLNCILLVGGQTRSLAIQEALEKEFKVTLNKSVNPDEAVSLGACIQANIILGEGDEATDILLLDVTPLSLGIETLGGVFTTLIEENTTIPCRKSEVFSTAVDMQTSIQVCVGQGNRPMYKDNKEIGRFMLDGILPAPRGTAKINVTFEIDQDGILKVSAKDEGTGKEQTITITTKGNLSKEEIERIKKEAEEHAEEDKKEREKVDIINKGDSIVFQNEKLLKEHDERLSEEEKNSFNELIEKMRKAVSEKNVDEINSIEKEINSKWESVAMKIYGQQQNTESSSTNENSTDDSKKDDEAEDIEFEEQK